MNGIFFVLGIILGTLIRDIKIKTFKAMDSLKEFNQGTEEAQFLEPITFKEKFKNAENVSELLDN